MEGKREYHDGIKVRGERDLALAVDHLCVGRPPDDEGVQDAKKES